MSEHSKDVIACKDKAWYNWAKETHVSTGVVEPAINYDNGAFNDFIHGYITGNANMVNITIARGAVERNYDEELKKRDKIITDSRSTTSASPIGQQKI